MSYCPKCGSKFENGRYKCAQCGTLLIYGGAGPKRPSLWERVRPYKNILILVALAIIIASTRAVFALTTIYWALVIGILAFVGVLWLRSRNRARPFNKNHTTPPQNPYSHSHRGPGGTPHKKHANVIPFRKKKENKSKIERQ